MSNKLRVAYMNNPDPVFFNELDAKICDEIRSQGFTVTQFELADISIKLQKSIVKFFLKESKDEFEFDAFLSYGYMSKFNDTAFMYLLTAIEKANKYVLHSISNLTILNNKLLQSFSYSNAHINIPESYSAFSIPAMRDVMATHFGNDETSVIKNLNDYGGDGVRKCNYTEVAVNAYARFFWCKEYTMVQKFVPDSLGRSVRVFLVGGKAVATAEYCDKTGDFRSNISFNRDFKLESLENSEKKSQYWEIAEKAAASIGEINVCGVDLLDSKEKGILVVEINGYPDLYDISKCTGIDVFKKFTQHFCNKATEFQQKGK